MEPSQAPAPISLLPRDSLCRTVLVLGVALAFTGLLLAGPARARMDGWTAALVLLHLALGALLAPLGLLLAWRALRQQHWSGIASSAGACSVAGFLTAAALIIAAVRGTAASEAILFAHEAAGCLAVLLAVIALARRHPPRRGPTGAGAMAGRPSPAAGAALAGLILIGLLAGAAAMTPAEPAAPGYDPEAYYAHLTATNARQAGNPLFPAGMTLTLDPGAQVRPAADCGATGCHPAEYRQWLGSPHQLAGQTPGYIHAAALYGAQRGPIARRWCEGCHSPLALADVQRSAFGVMPHASLSSEGVNCLTCHAATQVTELSGDGRFRLYVPSDYPFAHARDPRLRWLHAFLIRVRPGPHRRAFMKPALRQAEFCAACHRTSYNLPQNQYKFLRTADDYGTWQAGPDSAQSIHTFTRPGPLRGCQDCHNPHAGGIQAFRRSGVQASSDPSDLSNPSNPNTYRRTPESLSARTPEPLNAPPVTLDLLTLRRAPRTPGGPEEWVAPLDQAKPVLRPGETVTVELVVRNRGVGHEFPSGSGTEMAWIELTAADTNGRVLLCSGSISRAVPAEEAAPDGGDHAYGLIGLDRHSRRLETGDLWNMVTPLYYRSLLPGQPDADRRTLQPGESDVVHYRLQVPAGVVPALTLRARLWYRRAGPGGTDAERSLQKSSCAAGPAGTAPAISAAWRLESGPSVMAQDSVTLTVAAPTNTVRRHPVSDRRQAGKATLPVRSTDQPPLADRFYDYGVGLLLQGDLPRAQRAMRQVQAWTPRDERGYFGLGRVYLTEGDLLAARAQFEQAARLALADPRPRAFLAATERRMGQYDRALALLQPLVRDYPRDRLLWFDIGMSHYLSGHYEEASRAFRRMLDIDPDDLSAHYNLMRCLRTLHRVPEARREEVIYQSLREDDNARQIDLNYLHTHPLADRETRTVHAHPLLPVARDAQRGTGHG